MDGTEGGPLAVLVTKWKDEAARLAELNEHAAYEALSAAARDLEAAMGTAMPLTTAEVARRYRLSLYTVCEYAKAGRLGPAQKVGNRWRFGSDVRIIAVGSDGVLAETVSPRPVHRDSLAGVVRRRLRDRDR